MGHVAVDWMGWHGAGREFGGGREDEFWEVGVFGLLLVVLVEHAG